MWLQNDFAGVYNVGDTGDKGQETFYGVHEILNIWAIFLKAVNISFYTRKEVGALGEKVAAEYLKRQGFSILDRNFAWKTGDQKVFSEKAKVKITVPIA